MNPFQLPLEEVEAICKDRFTDLDKVMKSIDCLEAQEKVTLAQRLPSATVVELYARGLHPVFLPEIFTQVIAIIAATERRNASKVNADD